VSQVVSGYPSQRSWDHGWLAATERDACQPGELAAATVECWSFLHTREVLPSANVGRDPEHASSLLEARQDISGIVYTTPEARLKRSRRFWKDPGLTD